jgi:hypothetical protein
MLLMVVDLEAVFLGRREEDFAEAYSYIRRTNKSSEQRSQGDGISNPRAKYRK